MKPSSVYEKLCLIDPESALSHFTLGRSLFIEREFARALESFERCIECDPSYLLAYLLAGQACEKSGAVDQAKSLYQQGLARAEEANDENFISQFRVLEMTF